jgi:hypothetical protein
MSHTPQAQAFFHKHAGFSYDPACETIDEGKTRCAYALAQSEQWAQDSGYTYGWMIDEIGDSSEFSDDEPAWQLWVCDMYDETGAHVTSLGGIDFGRDGSPWHDPYRRVVEAELALEVMGNAVTA